jgi:hypothetical protein
MDQISSMLKEALGRTAVQALSKKLGADEQKTSGAMEMGLGMLLTGLARNSESSSGAEALAAALDRDHDGSVLDALRRNEADADSLEKDGQGILGHVFGTRRQAVENRLGQASGLGAGAMTQLMATLAPVVLGSLGKMKREKGLDAGALAGMLGQESRAAASKAPEATGMLGKILDADNDGDVMDDIGKLGGSLLGKLFR